MENGSDQVLIRAYSRERCESSFSELVHRHGVPVQFFRARQEH